MSAKKLIVVMKPDVSQDRIDRWIEIIKEDSRVESVSTELLTGADELVSTVRKKAEALQRVVDFAVTELSK